VKHLPADQRPREKLLARGAAALADAELLALLLRTGLPGVGVMALAEQVLARSSGFAGLLAADATTLKAMLQGVKGLGPAKQTELLAVMEMARRALAQPLQASTVFEQPERIRQYLALHLAGRSAEVFVVMFLDAQFRMLCLEEMFHGTLTFTQVHPREIIKRALALNAHAVVVAHNHPSGVAEPSKADEAMTQHLKAALRLVDVTLVDHLVVGQGTVVSMAERHLV